MHFALHKTITQKNMLICWLMSAENVSKTLLLSLREDIFRIFATVSASSINYSLERSGRQSSPRKVSTDVFKVKRN